MTSLLDATSSPNPGSGGGQVSTSVVYDAEGNTLSTTDPLGNQTASTYSADSLLLSTTTPPSQSLPLTIGSNPGSPTADPADTTAYTYDAAGDQVSSTDSYGATTLTAYTVDGRTQSVISAAGGAALSGTPFDNIGISSDTDQGAANYDGGGNSYSAVGLNAAGLSPGAQVTVNGLSYTWPAAKPGAPDNVTVTSASGGQSIAVSPPAGATKLGFLGSATNGASSGTATVTYTDGSTQSFTLSLGDWTQAAELGNTTVATMTYRNGSGGATQVTNRVFETEVSLTAGKTASYVTLPSTVSGGSMHIFAVSSAVASSSTEQTQYSYDGVGNLLAVTSPSANARDATNPGGIATQYTYSSDNLLLSTVTPPGSGGSRLETDDSNDSFGQQTAQHTYEVGGPSCGAIGGPPSSGCDGGTISYSHYLDGRLATESPPKPSAGSARGHRGDLGGQLHLRRQWR